MKYVHSDGKRMVVRDIGDEIWQAEGRLDAPLPIITHQIMTDDQARSQMRRVLETGLYSCKNLIAALRVVK